MDNKISIIVPAYNIEACLPKTLDSILTQTYTNIEVIVVNDGSEDSTGSIIERYAAGDARVKVIHKENGGVTSARLCGIAEASGEWVGFVDGDDYIEPDMYDRLLKNALQFDAEISHCGYQMVFPDGRIDYYYNSGCIVKQNGLQGCADLLAGGFIEPGLGNKLYHKSLLDDIHLRMDQSIRINEDLLMNYYLFKKADTAVFEDSCPYHYVLRKESAATSKLNEHKLWDPWHVTKRILADAPAELEPIVYQKLVRLLVGGATMDLKQNPALIRPYRKHTRKELRQELPRILFGNQCGIKLKIMVFWAAVWPASYCLVHKVYARITGHDKKYKVD